MNLRRYQNAQYVEAYISNLHGLHRSDRQNARKQAKQIRLCLVQAEEYYGAAKSVSLVTKPVLLYYSVMNLALAEILLKQTGESSLDRARDEHAHHGLTFHLTPYSKIAPDVGSLAHSLRARPHIGPGGMRVGTFELWHRSARHLPLGGELTVEHTGAVQIADCMWGTPEDVRLPLLPTGGISLLDCLAHVPGMYDILPLYSLSSRIIRGRYRARTDQSRNRLINELIIHPGLAQALDEFCENFKVYEPNRLNVNELSSGMICSWITTQLGPHVVAKIPEGAMWTREEIRFWPSDPPLNEFGFFYVALHILSNYARYYPDLWMKEVEESSELTILVETLLSLAEIRMPLLTLSELRRVCFVLEK